VPAISRAGKLILILCFLLFCILIVAAAAIMDRNRLRPQLDLPPGALPALRNLLAILSALALAWPWLLERQFLANPQRRVNTSGARVDPELSALVVGLAFTISPASYGLVLFLLGAPIQEFYHFAGAALLGSALWGAHRLTT